VTDIIQIATLLTVGIGLAGVAIKLGRLIETIERHDSLIREIAENLEETGRVQSRTTTEITAIRTTVNEHERRLNRLGGHAT